MQHTIQAGKYFLLGVAIILGVIILDQYTKWLVMETLLRLNGQETGFLDWLTTQKKVEFFINEREPFKTLTLMPFLSFVMVWNQGISFGIFNSNSQGAPLLLIGMSLIISAMLVIWLALDHRKTVAISLGLIIGGALANVVDRVRFNAVADFIDVHVQSYHWPAFNVADSCIVLGAGILMLTSLLDKERPNERKTG